MKFPLRKTILLVIISLHLMVQVNAIQIYDTDWTQEESITLEWGDTYSAGEYLILAEDFDRQAVQLIVTIYRNNENIHTAILSSGDSIVVNTIKITVNEIGGFSRETDTPFTKLTVFTMKPPALEIDVNTNMTSNGLMNCTFDIENSGGIRFSTITLNVTIPDDLIIRRTKYENMYDTAIPVQNGTFITFSIENVSAGSRETRWVQVEIPALPAEITYPVSVNATGYDIENKSFEISQEVNITVEPAIKVKKVPLWALINDSDDDFYVKDKVYVSITVFNSATTDAYGITLNETLMTSNFVLDPDSSLDWTFDLPARTSESIIYFMRPVRPGEVPISMTNVSREYKGHRYVQTIDPTTAKIFGPYFSISKTLNNYLVTPGEVVTVTVEAENTGNHASYLTLRDEIPDHAQFIEGTVNTSGVVKPGESITLKYSLKLYQIGDIRFPSAVGEYNERYDTGMVYSTRPFIQVVENIPTPTLPPDVFEENETINEKDTTENTIPGPSFITTLSGIILLSVLMRKRKKVD